jgi:hypothetical protein
LLDGVTRRLRRIEGDKDGRWPIRYFLIAEEDARLGLPEIAFKTFPGMGAVSLSGPSSVEMGGSSRHADP